MIKYVGALCCLSLLVGCSNPNRSNPAETERQIAEAKLELERIKIAEQRRIEEERKREEELEQAALEAEAERLKQEEEERESVRKEQFEISGKRYVRGKISEDCQSQSEFTCSSIEVTQLEYVGKTESGEYRANFEATVVLENWTQKKTVHFQGVLTHEYEDEESTDYFASVEWQPIGESSEIGVGGQLGILAALWAADAIINGSGDSSE